MHVPGGAVPLGAGATHSIVIVVGAIKMIGYFQLLPNICQLQQKDFCIYAYQTRADIVEVPKDCGPLLLQLENGSILRCIQLAETLDLILEIIDLGRVGTGQSANGITAGWAFPSGIVGRRRNILGTGVPSGRNCCSLFLVRWHFFGQASTLALFLLGRVFSGSELVTQIVDAQTFSQNVVGVFQEKAQPFVVLIEGLIEDHLSIMVGVVGARVWRASGGSEVLMVEDS